jgi:ATP/maltotriose-dependent transcriptional regulator MalT
MAKPSILDRPDEATIELLRKQAPIAHLQTLLPSSSPIRLLDGGTNPDLPQWRETSVDEVVSDTLGRRNPGQSQTGTSLRQVRRDLARAWRLMLALQIDEALHVVERLEFQLDNVLPGPAREFREATQLLRAAGLAFQDDSLAVLATVVPYLRKTGSTPGDRAARTLCRLGFWHIGEFDLFYSLPRPQPCARRSKLSAVSAMLELSIEAALALDHMRMSTAKQLALDASSIAKSTPKEAAGLATVPACLAAQVLYEEGSFDQAEQLLRDRLPAINASGPVESALRAYWVLTRIAKQRKQRDFAALLLREAEALGERRAWPRLVAACPAERALLLLQEGRTREARLVFEYLDRYAESHHAGSGHPSSEIMRYRKLTRWRVSWAEGRSQEAVAGLRQLYHRALETRHPYVGCGLAVELAEMLTAMDQLLEADALFFRAVRAAAAGGLYQVFLEGGWRLGTLLRRAYDRAAVPASTDRDLLPFLGSLLRRWDARDAGGALEQPSGRVSDTLSAREHDVLAMISQGFANKRIARTLDISPETVKSHVKRIFSKVAVSTRAEAVSRAGSLGLL